MTRIDNISRVIEALRLRMEQQERTRGRPSSSSAKAGSGTGADRIEHLRTELQRRLSAKPMGTESERRIARGVFVESVLTWEFGERLADDTRLPRLVSGVSDALENHPDTCKALDKLLDALRG